MQGHAEARHRHLGVVLMAQIVLQHMVAWRERKLVWGTRWWREDTEAARKARKQRELDTVRLAFAASQTVQVLEKNCTVAMARAWRMWMETVHETRTARARSTAQMCATRLWHEMFRRGEAALFAFTFGSWASTTVANRTARIRCFNVWSGFL